MCVTARCMAVLPSLVRKSRMAPPLTRAMTILLGRDRMPAIRDNGVSGIVRIVNIRHSSYLSYLLICPL